MTELKRISEEVVVISSRHPAIFLGGNKENHERFVTIAGIQVQIRNEHL
jgi:hypothetical protein